MEKYEKPIMEVVELEGIVGTFNICAPDNNAQSITGCGGGTLGYGGGGSGPAR